MRSGIKAARVLLLDSSMVTLCDKVFKRAGYSKEKGATFVVRMRRDIKFVRTGELELPDERDQEILVDETIRLVGEAAPPEHTIELVTNNGTWDAETISAPYKARWQIESFSKLIKQHLRIKSFVGTTKNAVLWQIWTAMLAILILMYLKARANSGWHMSNLIATIRIHPMSHLDLWDWLQQYIEGGLSPPNLCDEA